MTKKQLVGWQFGFLTALFWAVYAVSIRFGVEFIEHIHPVSFILQSLIFGAFALLIIANSGSLSIATIRNGHTWLYGTFQIMNHVALMGAFAYAITATSATLLLRMGVLISVIIGLFSGHLNISSKLGLLAICIGLFIVAMGLDVPQAGPAIFMVFLSAFAQVMQTVISAKHQQNNEASGGVRDECRVVGYIIAVTALAYALFLSISMGLGMEKILPNLFPTLEEFLSLSSLGLAAGVGIFIFAAMTYFKFVSTKYIGNHNFLIVVAFTPVLTFFLERMLGMAGVFNASTLSVYEIVGMVFVSGGAFLSAYYGMKLKKKRHTLAQQQMMKLAQKQVLATLVHFEEDKEKAAKALGISLKMLENILNSQKIYGLNTYKKLEIRFNGHVMEKDPVTGLDNRLSFMTYLKKLEGESFSIAFLDLNKFKPVNDTYGHEAGDEVLKAIGERLLKVYGSMATVSRLGGDEFCLLFPNKNAKEVQAMTHEMTKLIETPILIQKEVSIQVGTSIGVADNTVGKTGKDVLKAADENMYQHKHQQPFF